MLRSILRSCATLLFLIVIALSANLQAQSSNNDQAVDLSILSRSEALVPYMTAEQKVQYARLESRINSAKSDLKSGHYMANAKPSRLDPDRDLKPTIERGKRIMARAQVKLENAQKGLAELIAQVEEQEAQQNAIDLIRFDYTLDSASYDKAINSLSKAILNDCWELGYETLFFDGIYIQDHTGTTRAGAELRNSTYDTLIKADGTKFSVTIPVDLKLKANIEDAGSDIFSYENAAIFEDDKKALLVIELILPEGSSTGLLSLRAIDLKSQYIVASQLTKITDLASKLTQTSHAIEVPTLDTADLESAVEETEATEMAEDTATIEATSAQGNAAMSPAEAAPSEETKVLSDKTPDQLELRDESNTLETLSNLGSLYTFKLQADFTTTEVIELLSYTLLRNSGLLLTDSDFILRAYGESQEMSDTTLGLSNAHLSIEADEQKADTYHLSAVADNSDRVLSSGILSLSYSNREATTETDVMP